jgi:hypothetical protein
MSFVTFHPCPNCGSRDNYAEYTDNFYCFGCGKYESKRNLANRNLTLSKPLFNGVLYDGINLENKLPGEAKKWLYGASITLKEMEMFRYCYKKQWLFLISTDNYYVARNFSGYGAKYLSKGIKPFLTYGDGDVLVLVEDVLSAIVVGRVYCASPMLGAIPLKETQSHLKRFKRVILWGDYDKAAENVVNARKLSERWGFNIEVVITKQDPKYYSSKEIMEIVK